MSDTPETKRDMAPAYHVVNEDFHYHDEDETVPVDDDHPRNTRAARIGGGARRLPKPTRWHYED